MFSPPTVRNGPGGTVLVKHAYGDDQAKLRRESETLAALKHLPGVVETQGLIELEDRSELAITYVEGAPLTEHPPFGVDLLLDIVLSVAKTLVAMHELGIRHGAINREHVLVDRHGQVLLCGFGAASSAGSPGGADVSDDVRALANLLTFELERSEEAGIARVHRREAAEAASAATRLSTDPTGASLARWIAQLETTLRSARALSSGPAATTPRRATSSSANGFVARVKSISRLGWIAVALVALAGFVFWQTFGPGDTAAVTGAPTATSTPAAGSTDGSSAADGLLVNSLGDDAPGNGAAADPTPATPGQATAGSSVNGTTSDGAAQGGSLVFAAEPSQCPPSVEPSPARLEPAGASATFAVHTDGDRCVDQVAVGTSGATGRPMLVVGETAWEVGEAGDLVAVGDWNCDGVATPAVVRPTTGHVFVFVVWPTSGSVMPAVTAQVPVGATALVAQPSSGSEPHQHRCDQLVVSVGDASYAISSDSAVAVLAAMG